MISENKVQLLGLGLILGTCFIQGTLSQSRSIDPIVKKQIDDYITSIYLPGSKISKMGLSIVKDNGEILYSTGFGLADQEKGIPNGNQTQFLIGSTTKSFTALVVIKVLHEMFPEKGEAVLDTPIRELIPSVNFTLIDRFRSEHTTFRDLLAHRMCLFRDDLQLVAEPFSRPSEIMYRQRYSEQTCGMRSEFQYNNQMYVIAGELIGILANKTYIELLHNLLKDIGMFNSSLLSKSDDFSNMPFRGQPYYIMDNVSHPINTDLIKRVAVNNPAGGIYATPNDMANYMRFHFNKGNVDGKQLIPEEVMAWQKKPASVMPSMFFKSTEDDLHVSTFGYGLGLMLASYDGWQCIHHGGYFPPYQTLMSLFPSQKLGIFTSTNEGPVWMNPVVLHAFIFEALRGTVNATEKISKLQKTQEAIRAENEKKKEKALKKFLEFNTKTLYSHSQTTNASVVAVVMESDSIVGKYGSGSSGDAEIFKKFNKETNTTELYVRYGKWYKGWLKNIGGTVYQIKWDSDVIQDFYASGDPKGIGYARVDNETLEFLWPVVDDYVVLGKFKLGVSLDTLPPIPYAPDSCGSETAGS